MRTRTRNAQLLPEYNAPPPPPSHRRHVRDEKRRVPSLLSLARARLSRDRRRPSGAATQYAVISAVKCAATPPPPRPWGLLRNARRRVSTRLPSFAHARRSRDRRLPSCAFTPTYMQRAAHGDGVIPLGLYTEHHVDADGDDDCKNAPGVCI